VNLIRRVIQTNLNKSLSVADGELDYIKNRRKVRKRKKKYGEQGL